MPFPIPLAPETTVIKEVFEVAVQAQVGSAAVIVKPLLLLEGPRDALLGTKVKAHAALGCTVVVVSADDFAFSTFPASSRAML